MGPRTKRNDGPGPGYSDADDVARHQVRRELDAVEGEAQGARNGAHEQGLREAGNTHQQAVAAAEDPQEHLVHHLLLPDDDLVDLPLQPPVILAELLH